MRRDVWVGPPPLPHEGKYKIKKIRKIIAPSSHVEISEERLH